MHWRHVSMTMTPCWGSRLVVLRARVVLAEHVGAQPLSQCAGPGGPGPARRYGMQGLALWLHAWRWRKWQCLVWPPTCGGALLWRHMHMVYTQLHHTIIFFFTKPEEQKNKRNKWVINTIIFIDKSVGLKSQWMIYWQLYIIYLFVTLLVSSRV